MNTIITKPILITQARPFRQTVLRPTAPPSASIYPADETADSLHIGTFLDQRLVGIASIFHEAPPNKQDDRAWRLRGMAVLKTMRRKGYGLALLQACYAHIKANNGVYLWCNSRLEALAFYKAAGFKQQGQPYKVPKYGTRYFMKRAMDNG